MQIFAHVIDGVVRAVEEIDDGLVPGVHIFHPDYAKELVPAPVGVSQGWTHAGGVFSAPVIPINELRARALAAVRAAAMRFSNSLYGHPVHAAAFGSSISGDDASFLAQSHGLTETGVAMLAGGSARISGILATAESMIAAAEDKETIAGAVNSFVVEMNALSAAVATIGRQVTAPTISISGIND